MKWLDRITDSMDMSLGKLGEGQGGLACCGSWGCKESDLTERLINNKAYICNDCGRTEGAGSGVTNKC